MKTAIVIPARLASTRLPNKPLLEVCGKSLIRHVYERARQTDADYVTVATPDSVIIAHCEEYSINCHKTSPLHTNGTQRCAEVLLWLNDVSILIGWQVDEINIRPEWVNQLIHQMQSSTGWLIGTLVAPLPNESSITKAVLSGDRCVWFSRRVFGHIGIYAYRSGVLRNLMSIPVLRDGENLEQLDWLRFDHSIYAVEVPEFPGAVNTQEDLDRFRAMWENTECQLA